MVMLKGELVQWSPPVTPLLVLRLRNIAADNHIWSQGSITDTVKAARRVCGFSSKIEVECRSLDEALEAVGGYASGHAHSRDLPHDQLSLCLCAAVQGRC